MYQQQIRLKPLVVIHRYWSLIYTAISDFPVKTSNMFQNDKIRKKVDFFS